MTVQSIVRGGTTAASSLAFDRFAGVCGLLAGCVSFLYAIAFIVLGNVLLSGLTLMLSGLLTSVILVALYSHLQETEIDFARLAIALVGIGALGSLVHGGYDLANTINPPDTIPSNIANLPSAVDPRGLLTFGMAGLGILTTAWLMQRSKAFPAGLAIVGYLLAVLLVVLYLGRLIILNATSPLIVVPAIVSGFVVNPLWNIWIGLVLLRQGGR